MTTVADIAVKVRSKNAGPFWLTVDIFCGDPDAYAQITQSLSTDRVAAAFQADGGSIKRFEIDSLNVIKFSLPRPVTQGDIADRDMHGAGWAPLIAELSLN
jgi:hypothetical protein